MANLAIAALETLRGYLLAPDGLNARVYAIAVRDMIRFPEIKDRNVVVRHASPELLDAGTTAIYPSVCLYCERIENRLERKFTEFAGRVFLVAEARVSGEDVEGLDGDAARLAEGVAETLAAHHGKWTEQLAFDGKYEVRFEPVREGGANFVQVARVEIELLAHA